MRVRVGAGGIVCRAGRRTTLIPYSEIEKVDADTERIGLARADGRRQYVQLGRRTPLGRIAGGVDPRGSELLGALERAPDASRRPRREGAILPLR